MGTKEVKELKPKYQNCPVCDTAPHLGQIGSTARCYCPNGHLEATTPGIFEQGEEVERALQDNWNKVVSTHCGPGPSETFVMSSDSPDRNFVKEVVLAALDGRYDIEIRIEDTEVVFFRRGTNHDD